MGTIVVDAGHGGKDPGATSVIGTYEKNINLAVSKELTRILRRQGWNVGTSASQIIPIIVGAADRTMRLAHRLRSRGLFVPGIRPPTVPEGSALLRVSLTYGHTSEMIAQLVTALGAPAGDRSNVER